MARHACGVCGLEADFVPIYAAAKIAAVSRSTMYYWIQKRWVHWCELASGRKVICCNSLVRDLSKTAVPAAGTGRTSLAKQRQPEKLPGCNRI